MSNSSLVEKEVLDALSILYYTSFVNETLFSSFSPQPFLIVVLHEIIQNSVVVLQNVVASSLNCENM